MDRTARRARRTCRSPCSIRFPSATSSSRVSKAFLPKDWKYSHSSSARFASVGAVSWESAALEPSTASTSRASGMRSEEHTSELQSQSNLVCRLLLEKKKKQQNLPQNMIKVNRQQ